MSWDTQDSGWLSYTPAIGGSTTAPTLATTKMLRGRYRVRGKVLSLQFDYFAASATGAAAGSGAYLIGLPAGLTIDTSIAVPPGGVSSVNYGYQGPDGAVLGEGVILSGTGGSAPTQSPLLVMAANTAQLCLFAALSATLWGSGAFGVLNSNTSVRFTAEIPLL